MTTTTTTTGMYAGWSPAPSLEEHLPIENVEAVGILSPEIICNLIGDISKCLSNPLQVEQMYSTETGLRWILQVTFYNLIALFYIILFTFTGNVTLTLTTNAT